jgi:acetyl-CoA synthetase
MNRDNIRYVENKKYFLPPKSFVANGLIKTVDSYKKLYTQSIKQPASFWSTQADKHIFWFKKYRRIMDWKPPYVKWFIGGRLNVSYNCIDRHLDSINKDKLAIIWEGESVDKKGNPTSIRKFSYADLHKEVCIFANILTKHNVKKGDRVLIYLPMIPEAVFAMLACTRIGAIHSVVFGGFSAHSLADRLLDVGAKIVITANSAYRKGIELPLMETVNEAIGIVRSKKYFLVEKVIIIKHTNRIVNVVDNRDVWFHIESKSVNKNCIPESMDSESPLFILYTSGSTGKPKGIIHTTGGYLLGVKMTSLYVLDLKPKDIYWCTADVGWITGHSYVVYGPLSCGATVFMYEGSMEYPSPKRIWEIIDRHKISILYTAPTAIRTFMKFGIKWPQMHSLNSLRLLGSVGEPLNPAAWDWYNKFIGKSRCPIVDTWWQTETGCIMASSIPSAIPTKPGSVGLPFFGVSFEILNDNNKRNIVNKNGKLVINKPWPSMLRGIWNDKNRFIHTYWKHFSGKYYTGDGGRIDKSGYLWITGRVDDVLNVSGHRIGTAEIENVLVGHKSVAESAVVGKLDDVKGQVIIAFITLKANIATSLELKKELILHVKNKIGAFAKPADIIFTKVLPKTRSGKIIRRILRDIVDNKEMFGDITTLDDMFDIKNYKF